MKRVCKQQALDVIEILVSDDFCMELECELAAKRLRGRSKIAAKKLMAIYRYAHAVNRRHSCHSVHTNWRSELSEAHTALKGEMGD